MRLTESNIARIGLVALALVHWRYAAFIEWAGVMPLHPTAVILVIALYASSFALLLGALASGDLERRSRAAFVSFALIVVCFAYRDAMWKLHSPTLATTDGHAFMDVSARMLLDGKNPYKHSLIEAFRVYRMPLSFSTPLLNGDVSDRAAYPALSFLVLVPFVLMHVPTYLAYAACFVVAVGLILWKSPWWARALIVALYTFNETLLTFSFAGVTDTVWALCLVGVVLAWKRPRVAAVLLGLACAYKQHAWFAAPFLVARLCHEQEAPPWKGVPRRFVLTVAAVFAVVNLPFVLWGAGSWSSGVLEPLTAPMVQLSEGLTSLSMTGYAAMPRAGTSVFFWSAYALALFVYVRHPRTLRDWCWVLPGVVLWFGYRALMSYWYFYSLPAVAAIVIASSDDDRGATEPSWALTTKLATGYAVALAAFVVWCAMKPSPFEITMRAPFETWDTRVFRVRARVTNRSGHDVRPRFSVQSAALQPLAWQIERGPTALAGGATGDYVLRTSRGYTEYGVETGARLSVSDDGSPGERAFVDLPLDPSAGRIDAVPNGRFQFMETRSNEPLSWTLESSDANVTLHIEPKLEEPQRLTLDFEEEANGDAAAKTSVASFVATQRLDAITPLDEPGRFAHLATTLALPESSITIRVRVPDDANRTPFDRLYGLRVTVFAFHAFVLFGDEIGEGRLPTGEPFTSFAAPRGQWSDVQIALRALLERLHAPLRTRRFMYARERDVDVPTVPLELGLFASVPRGATAHVSFGAISQDDLRPVEALAARGEEESAGVLAWHGAFDIDNGDYGPASDLLSQAIAKEPTADRYLLLGDAQYLDGQPRAAADSYSLALGYGPSPAAERGLGWALVGTNDVAGALLHLTRGRGAFGAPERARPQPRDLDVVRDLATAAARRGDCEAAHVLQAAVAVEDTAVAPPRVEGCD